MQRWSVVPTELKKDSRQGEGKVASEITIAVAVLCHIKRVVDKQGTNQVSNCE